MIIKRMISVENLNNYKEDILLNMKLVIYSLLLLKLMLLTGFADISISAKPVKIELGDGVSENILDYIYVEPNIQQNVYKEAQLDVSEIESMVIGEYEAVVKYREKVLIIPVIVEDTTPPVIEPLKKSFWEGDRIIADDLVEVSDYSDTSLYLFDSTSGVQMDFVTLEPGITVIVKAIDKSGNETIVEIAPQIFEKDKDEIPTERSYESTDSFPYGELDFVDNYTYEIIKEAYGNIEWDSEFETGNIEQYDFYKKKYKELLDGDVKFLKTEQYTYSEVSKWMYLYEFLGLNENYDPSDVFNGDSQGLGLIFFDVDGDEAPELCVTEHVGAGAIHDVYIFKYEIDSDRILLLKSYSGPVSQLFGTKTIGICWEDRQFRLEKFGLDLKNEMTVEFMNDFFYLDGNNNYLVSFPVYTDQNKRIELGNEIKRQGYYDESRELFFFHVTKEQYNELTNSFFDEYSKLDMKQEQVTYTYKELFKAF